MTVNSQVELAEAIRAGEAHRLRGTAESSWLDFKQQPYRLKDPWPRAELAKDVAALANAQGGCVVIAVDTEQRGDQEVAVRERPLPARLAEVKRHRDIVNETVFPAVRGLHINWYPVIGDPERGLLLIEVPEQAEAEKPFVTLQALGRSQEKQARAIAVPVRQADHTRWESPQHLQHLMQLGRHYLRDRDVLAARAVRVGAGLDDNLAEQFRRAYQQAGGLDKLGLPDRAAHAWGPGVIQNLDGGTAGAAAILAMERHEPVVLIQDEWRAFESLGGGQGRAADLVGYPVTVERHPNGRTRIDLLDAQGHRRALFRPDKNTPWKLTDVRPPNEGPGLRPA